MINVNQITSRLASMPDAALQQYASLHKNDPYTVSLAMSESNRRKEMRASAQPQPGQQPTVVDQGIAGMGGQPAPQMPQGQAQAMPENTGIGTLPQPHMQKMAEGGIVAFSDGGDIPRYQTGGLMGDMPGFQAGNSYANAMAPYRQAAAPAAAEKSAADQQVDAANQMALQMTGIPLTEAQRSLVRNRVENASAEEAAGRKAGASGQPFNPSAYATPSALAAQSQTQAGTSSNADRGNFPGQGSTGMATPAPTQATGAPPASTPPAPQGGIGMPRTAAPTAFDSAALRKKLMGESPDEDIFAERRAANTSEAVAAEEAAMAKRKEENAAENEGMFASREERIGKREAALDVSKETNKGMAFLQAGLSMMQARGPGLSAIAQGAGVGLKQYGEGIEKIKSAQEKLDEARDRIDELKQNKSTMDKKEIQGMEQGIRALTASGKKDLLNGSVQAFGWKKSEVESDVKIAAGVSEGALDRKSRETTAAYTANRALMQSEKAEQGQQLQAATAVYTGANKIMLDSMQPPEVREEARKDALNAQKIMQRIGGMVDATPGELSALAGYSIKPAPKKPGT